MSFPNSAELARNLTTYFIRRFEVAEIDKWKVSKLVASDGAPDPALSADASGYLSAAVQPLFSAYNSVTDNNVTGDATIYTVICDTEIVDRNSNYNNATGIFTAPVTGKYLFVGCIDGRNIGAAHTTYQINIATSNRSYICSYENGIGNIAPGGVLIRNCSVIADMDAADTSLLQFIVNGGAKTVGVFGTTSPQTYFQGYLLI